MSIVFAWAVIGAIIGLIAWLWFGTKEHRKITKQIWYVFTDDVYSFFKRWEMRIKWLWYRLWIRKNEFDKSLGMDYEVYMYMSGSEIERYKKDLLKRRVKAHKKDRNK